jgi:hydroxymethylpyrimidine kinase/phosphomethylpyrimidine kinase
VTLWLVGGLDPTGGAGVLRDFATASALEPSLDVRVAVTAWTRQGHGAPAVATAVPPSALQAQLDGFPPPSAVKLGLVPDPLVEVVLGRIERASAAVVLDPVLRASDGGALGSSVHGLARLWKHAMLTTPNRGEAVAFAGDDIDDDALLAAIAKRHGGTAVLLKGGRIDDDRRVVDRLWRSGRLRSIERQRHRGPDPRGTGCALATAIACGLATGLDLDRAVDRAIAWLDDARRRVVMRGDTAYLPVG